MQSLLQEFSAQYDWVIVDTPPVAMLPDAPLLTASVDRVLIVIEAGRTPYDAIQKTVQSIGQKRIIGAVLNRAEASLAAPYGADYAGYYARR
jgi:Mrp family chromosome partitioning ATPase